MEAYCVSKRPPRALFLALAIALGVVAVSAERTLAAVACTPMILIEAHSSAYHGGMLILRKRVTRGGGLMRFYNAQHQFYCGIDLHARTMYVCILSHAGEIVVHRNMPTSPDALLKTIAPYGDRASRSVWCRHSRLYR